MSLLQKPTPATIEVVYSKVRKYDMKKEHQKTCSLLINIIKHILQKHEIQLNEILIPTHKDNNADIYFEVIFKSKQEIDEIKNEIMIKTVGSLSSIEVLIDI